MYHVAYDTALNATSHQPHEEPGTIRVPVFIESGFLSGTHYGDDPGGYAMVFRRIHSDNPDDIGKNVEMAWHVKPCLKYNLIDGMAIAQAIRTITAELRASRDTTLASAGSNKDILLNRVIIQIFSAKRKTLEALQASQASGFVDRDESLWNKVVGAIIDESLRLGELGLDVGLELHWCPGNCNQDPSRVPAPLTRARELAHWARRKHKNHYRVGEGLKQELDVSTSVFEEFLPDFQTEHYEYQLYLNDQKLQREIAKLRRRNKNAEARWLARQEEHMHQGDTEGGAQPDYAAARVQD